MASSPATAMAGPVPAPVEASGAAPATPAPAVPAEEPARAVARVLRELAGDVVDPSHREVP